MEWLSKLRHLLPLHVKLQVGKWRIVLLHKINVLELEVCKPKGILRERSFWRMEKVDFYHLLPDGTIKHTPGDL